VRLGAAVGDLRKVLAEEVRAGERAAMTAVRTETDQVKQELRKQVTSAFGGNARGIANAWRSQVFPRTGQSLRPAGLIWTKVPNVVDAFERGALIRAKGGRKFLAIPTGFNAARGRRGRDGKGIRVTPAQMVASQQAFLRPFKSGLGFVWCLPLYEARGVGRGRRGRGRTQVIAGASPRSARVTARAARRGRAACSRRVWHRCSCCCRRCSSPSGSTGRVRPSAAAAPPTALRRRVGT
jgi:hypothetical protein